MLALLAAAALTGCVALDGDTLRCGEERIRLTAIDAPELPGHCRRGRTCAPGDPQASKETLSRAVSHGHLTIVRLGTDRYGRTVGDVYLGRHSLSCWMVRWGQAIYWPRYDKGGRIRKQCGFQ